MLVREGLEEALVESGTGGESGPDIQAMADTISNDLFDGEDAELVSKADADPASADGEPSGPARTPDGKFAPKPAPVPAPAPSAEVTPGATPATTPDQSATIAATGQPIFQPPKTWRKDAAEAFASLPAIVQAEITKREQDIFRGIAQHRENAQVGHVFNETLKPFIPLFQKYQLNPAEATKRALTAHFNLTLSSPAVKVDLARNLLSEYGISLESLGVPAVAGGLEGGVPPGQSLMQQEIQSLRAQLAEVGETTSLMQRRHMEQVHSQVAGDVEKFASNPANAYFNELTEDMEQLIRSGQAATLPEAYEKAIWLNPAVRAKEVARLTAEQSSKVTAQTTAKVSEARRASAVNVRSQGHPTSGPATPIGTMDDTLEATMKLIKDRG